MKFFSNMSADHLWFVIANQISTRGNSIIANLSKFSKYKKKIWKKTFWFAGFFNSIIEALKTSKYTLKTEHRNPNFRYTSRRKSRLVSIEIFLNRKFLWPKALLKACFNFYCMNRNFVKFPRKTTPKNLS